MCRDLGIDDQDLLDYNPDEPIAPRTFALRSTHGAAKKARGGAGGAGGGVQPSSTGLHSAGGPAPSDARTGVSGGGGGGDTAGTEVGGWLGWHRRAGMALGVSC